MSHIIKIKIHFFHYNFRIIQILNVHDKILRHWHLKDTQVGKFIYTCILYIVRELLILFASQCREKNIV